MYVSEDDSETGSCKKALSVMSIHKSHQQLPGKKVWKNKIKIITAVGGCFNAGRIRLYKIYFRTELEQKIIVGSSLFQ